MNYLILAAVSFLFVLLKTLQQRNNIHNNWMMVPLMSYGLAFCGIIDIYLGYTEVHSKGLLGLVLVAFANGTGGSLGCLLGMYLHNRYF